MNSITKLSLSFCLLLAFNLTNVNLFGQDLKKSTPPTQTTKPGMKAGKPKVIEGSSAANPEELIYTGIIYSKCGNDIVEVKRALMPRKFVVIGANNKITKVDADGFKRSIKYNAAQACKLGSGTEFFALQKNANLQKGETLNAKPSSCVVELINDFCHSMSSADPCNAAKYCACEEQLQPRQACRETACKDMVIWCNNQTTK
ncbi:MAG: hypothetical protein IPI30_06725 [Saprospiraceae bacterium]|nr:hypothetical protein [Candidatus Vicinibacter affinis]